MRISSLKFALFFAFCISPLLFFAQPGNDACDDAIDFGNFNESVQVCQSGTTIGASPEFPYPSQTNCNPSGNTPTSASDVWYQVTPNFNTLSIDLSSTMANGVMSIYTGSCGSFAGIGCELAVGGNIAGAIFAPVTPGNVYYIQISGNSGGDVSDFDLCITNINDSSLCVAEAHIEVTPDPTGGSYGPGDTITFCYTVDSFIQQNANWFSGIEVIFGPGWDQATFVPTPPPSCDGSGNWAWYPGITSSATGATAGAGFYYDSNAGGPLDGDPGNNFGDAGMIGCNSWTFCWDIATSTNPNADPDISLTINHFADGEIGSYTELSCSNDPPFTFNIALSPCSTPTFSTVPASCSGVCDGSATVQAMGELPHYYSWATGENTQTIYNLCAGTHYVTVTDQDTCVSVVPIEIGILNEISVQGYALPVSCFGGLDGVAWTLPSGGQAPYSFYWVSTGSVDSIATNLPNGDNWVTITDANGCSIETMVNVPNPPRVNIDITTIDAACFGYVDGSAQADVTGGVGGYSYFWSSGSSVTPVLFPLTPGIHSITVTDGNLCTAVDTFEIDEPPRLYVDLETVDEVCFQADDGTVAALPYGGVLPYNYGWSFSGDTSNMVFDVPPGNHTVTVTDDNGCIEIETFQIIAAEPVYAIASADTSFCEGAGGVQVFGTGDNGTEPYYYSWTCSQPFCGISDPFDSIPTVNPHTSMMYYLTVTDFNGCVSDPDSVFVEILSRPKVNLGHDIWTCPSPGPGAVLNPSISNAPGPYEYLWMPSEGLNDPTIPNIYVRPDSTTIYTLVVTSINGCSSDLTTTDSLSSITVNVQSRPMVEIPDSTEICLLDNTELYAQYFGAGPDYSVEWSPSTGLSDPNISNPIASPQNSTHYFVTAWSNGCPSYADSIFVKVNTLPTVSAGSAMEACYGAGDYLDGTGGGVPGVSEWEYYWSPSEGLDDPTSSNPFANPELSTMYYLEIESPMGCRSALDSVLFTVRPSPVVTAKPPTEICAEDSFTQIKGTINWPSGSAPSDIDDLIINWTPGLTLSDSTVLDPISYPEQTTHYYISTSYQGCEYIDSTIVFMFPSLNFQIHSDTTVICKEDSVLISLSGGIGAPNFNWLTGIEFPDTSIQEIWVQPEETTTYLIEMSEGDCSMRDSLTIEVLPLPEVDYASSMQSGCTGLEVNFLDLTKDAISLEWDFGDGHVSNEPNPTHIYTDPGHFVVQFSGIGIGGCRSTVNHIEVSVSDGAIPEFTSTPELPVTLVFPQTRVSFHDLSPNAEEWFWEFGDGEISYEQNPTHQYEAPGTYDVSLSVGNADGCGGKVNVGPVVVKYPDLDIPNVFSPNEDGSNDLFQIKYDGNEAYSLTVMDRWGGDVFKSSNINEGWDGNYFGSSKPAPSGVYFYKLDIGNKGYSGHITLLR